IIIGPNGLLIDVEADVTAVLGKAQSLPEVVFRSPQTLVSEVGETWRLLGKRVQGGSVILGLVAPSSMASADVKLADASRRFGNTIAEALSVKPRQIDVDVDYAVLGDDGALKAGWGGVPLKIAPRSPSEIAALKPPVTIAGKPYLLFSRPIVNSVGGQVGTVIVPQELNLEQEALAVLDRFNLGIIVIAALITVGLGIYLVGREVLRDSRRSGVAAGIDRFILGERLAIEETREYEFKEVIGNRPADTIANLADEYAVAFLNSEGGRIFWGVRDKDRVVVGVRLPAPDRDRLRRLVANKLHAVQPQIDPTQYRLEFHAVESPETADSELTVIELIVPKVDPTEPYFTGGGEAFVRVDGVTRRLSGPPLVDWIRRRT
ncbi:MAG: putative DNA binding domain-containing protein, partial [Verrucomicrobia bacterium]|nr:putative DNA binding domain-containing protein [Verrucomicrobiota bacterium]